jgi:hypothetical protein
MPRTRSPYRPEFRERIIALTRPRPERVEVYASEETLEIFVEADGVLPSSTYPATSSVRRPVRRHAAEQGTSVDASAAG